MISLKSSSPFHFFIDRMKVLMQMRLCALCFFLASCLSVESFAPQPQRALPNLNIKWKIDLIQKSTISQNTRATTALRETVADSLLQKGDKLVLKRVVRIASHSTALATLFYFGLVSMTSMMGGPGPLMPTLPSVLTKGLGSTTNGQFSAFFPTLITPPSYIFLIWPLISVVQLVTVAFSALFPFADPTLSGDDLSALSLANLAASTWLFVSSQATKAILPLASFLILPVVPLFAGYPLRTRVGDAKKVTLQNVAFQLFSSFTTIASFLALTIELQHGGRIPFFKGKAELCAMVFLSLYYGVLQLRGHGAVKRTVHAAAIVGILSKRVLATFAAASTPVAIACQFTSVSFVATLIVAWTALRQFFNPKL